MKYRFEVGDRVAVTVKNLKLKKAPAIIMYIQQDSLMVHHMAPIQVELDSPYDDSGHRIIRVSLKEVKPLEENNRENDKVERNMDKKTTNTSGSQ